MNFQVIRMWEDSEGKDQQSRQNCETRLQADALAKNWKRKQGDTWIEERQGSRWVTVGEPLAEPMTREHLAQLRVQIRSLAKKTSLKENS